METRGATSRLRVVVTEHDESARRTADPSEATELREDYWARVQELRATLERLRPAN